MIKTGIYKIVNQINGKIYVGSALDMLDRWNRHKNQLKSKKHHSKKLQRSYNKHGADNFKYETIEECEKDKLIEKEQYYIDLFDSYNNGYNCCPKAGSPLGVKHTDEARKNMSNSQKGKSGNRKGKKHSQESKNKIKEARKRQVFSKETGKKMSKSRTGIFEGRKNPAYNPTPVLQYDLKNNFIKEWKDLVSLKENGFNSKLISSVCRGTNKTHAEYKWKYKTI